MAPTTAHDSHARPSDPPSTNTIAWRLVDAAPDGILIVDEDGHIVVANRQAEHIFRYEHGALLDLGVDDLVPQPLRARHQMHRGAFNGAPATRPMGLGLILHGLRRDGTEFPIEISLSALDDDGTHLTIAFARDASDQHELREAQRVAAMEEERQRLAHQLLDSAIHRLFRTGLLLQGGTTKAQGAQDETMSAAVTELDEAIREIRSVVLDAGRMAVPSTPS